VVEEGTERKDPRTKRETTVTQGVRQPELDDGRNERGKRFQPDD